MRYYASSRIAPVTSKHIHPQGAIAEHLMVASTILKCIKRGAVPVGAHFPIPGDVTQSGMKVRRRLGNDQGHVDLRHLASELFTFASTKDR